MKEMILNFLEKIQLPLLPSLFGAILAGVDYVLMGAGIPRAIPGVLDRLCRGEQVEISLDVEGASRDESFVTTFDPAAFWGGDPPQLHRPRFLAIVPMVVIGNMVPVTLQALTVTMSLVLSVIASSRVSASR